MLKCLMSTLLLALPLIAQAQEWPTKSVRFVVQFAPGGTSDIAVAGQGGPDSFAAFIKKEQARWEEVVKWAGIVIE